MCGIAAIIFPKSIADKSQALGMLSHMLWQIEHRGDAEHFGETKILEKGILGTNRLAIVDREHGRQPKSDKTNRYWIVLNGEIYNYKNLKTELEKLGYQFESDTDTEVIVNGFKEWGERIAELLDGEFAFIIYDRVSNEFFAARDHIGIKPLYFAKDHNGTVYLASEQKAILPFSKEITTLLPGHYVTRKDVKRYFQLNTDPLEMSEKNIIKTFKALFEKAVEKRLNTDLPVCLMFSGGIDSTAVLHAARKYHKNITAITIGFPGAVDISVAKKYCKEFNIKQEVVMLNEKELIDVIPYIVRGAEFFESIDVMDSCLSYFGYKHANKLGFKIALCGEGSDELLAGYDFFLTHPNPTELMRYRVNNIYRTDCQRLDRTGMLNRVEVRVPFLDKEFLKFSYRISMNMKLRNGVAKWVLREAFKGDLPDFYNDRKKVRMPDGTGMRNLLYDYTGKQDYKLDPKIVKKLSLTIPQHRFFMGKYLEAGFPVPKERFKKVGYDYSEHGYFNFATK